MQLPGCHACAVHALQAVAASRCAHWHVAQECRYLQGMVVHLDYTCAHSCLTARVPSPHLSPHRTHPPAPQQYRDAAMIELEATCTP